MEETEDDAKEEVTADVTGTATRGTGTTTKVPTGTTAALRQPAACRRAPVAPKSTTSISTTHRDSIHGGDGGKDLESENVRMNSTSTSLSSSTSASLSTSIPLLRYRALLLPHHQVLPAITMTV